MRCCQTEYSGRAEYRTAFQDAVRNVPSMGRQKLSKSAAQRAEYVILRCAFAAQKLNWDAEDPAYLRIRQRGKLHKFCVRGGYLGRNEFQTVRKYRNAADVFAYCLIGKRFS